MRSVLCLIMVGALVAADSSPGPGPSVVEVGLVSPNVLALAIHDGDVIRHPQIDYEQQPGDVVGGQAKMDSSDSPSVTRKGQLIGYLTADHKMMWPLNSVVNQVPDRSALQDPKGYTIASAKDKRFSGGTQPATLFIKSKPMDSGQIGGWKFDYEMHHVVYLPLEQPWLLNVPYTISCPGIADPVTFTLTPATVSEAIHVSQIGFRPTDTPKIAFISCWMGTGGSLVYEKAPQFVVRSAKGKELFKGQAVLRKSATDTECARGRDHTRTEVWSCDFSAVTTPGTVTLEVAGVGSSRPIPIADDVWTKAMVVSARGQFHQRSGIALGQPYTDFIRPRNFHPDDGVIVYQSTCSLMDSGNGMNARGTDKGNFKNLTEGATSEVVPNAWGGYADAGDWDRRIQHLSASRLLIDLVLENGATAEAVVLNIPESNNDLPDLIDEALYDIDFYRRMMTPEGGVRGGIESAAHPRLAEGSWQESLTVYAYAPDVWSTYQYVSAAARVAWYLQGAKKSDRAKTYQESALHAMAWAEQQLPTLDYEPLPVGVRDERNLAAADLYRLTGDQQWHTIFKDTCVTAGESSQSAWKKFTQDEAGWVYIQTKDQPRDEAILAKAKELLLADADRAIATQAQTGFGWTSRDTHAHPGWGLFGVPQAGDLIRAWKLTGELRYREAAVLASQISLGANGDNMTYTTGVGYNPPRNAFFKDAMIQGIAPPPGITCYGPADPEMNKDYWALAKVLKPVFTPAYETWPSTEFFVDVPFVYMTTEYTVMQTQGPTAYVWGSLGLK